MNQTRSMKTYVGRAALGCPVKRSSTALYGSQQLQDRTAPRFLRRDKREATLLIAFLATLLLSTLASAQTLTGTVKNSTTGKPAAGDEVVLLTLGQGMEEA